ncbi:hypothetical protein NPIL_176911 [Nephila pilipes]|uniref:Uncharacterized protein n=1 Tax=Nephila pilipes TaxID=299642 RepID=A0A8X6T218_NEPPI|nr:hypothetical protein NPIL_176911 [Nephila pilipes]
MGRWAAFYVVRSAAGFWKRGGMDAADDMRTVIASATSHRGSNNVTVNMHAVARPTCVPARRVHPASHVACRTFCIPSHRMHRNTAITCGHPHHAMPMLSIAVSAALTYARAAIAYVPRIASRTVCLSPYAAITAMR